jgi:hypothetical protein
VPGAAGGSAQRVASGLAVQLVGVGLDQVVHDDRVHGSLLDGGKKMGRQGQAGALGLVWYLLMGAGGATSVIVVAGPWLTAGVRPVWLV